MVIQKLLHKKNLYKTLTIFIAVLLTVFAVVPKDRFVKAASVQEQITSLQQQNADYKSTIARLQGEATSYQDAIAQLKAAIDTLQGQINANTAEQVKLQADIVTAEAELIKQKALLGDNIKAIYLEGQISTIEMLASSKDLSEFVDKEQYRNSVKDKIKATLEKITAIKLELTGKKEAVEALLKVQNEQQAQLNDSRSEQGNLLAYNEGQQNDFNQKTKDNQSKIDGLIASQRRANFDPTSSYAFLRFPGTIGSFNPNSYPYANAGFGMSPGSGCVDNDGPDAWGYCTRQCVSFAAWAVEASGRSAPISYGNARDWIYAAKIRGIEVSSTPQPGDIAISTSGNWGHAMYVESVSGSKFTTYEYNTQLDGKFYSLTRNF